MISLSQVLGFMEGFTKKGAIYLQTGVFLFIFVMGEVIAQVTPIRGLQLAELHGYTL
jgi:hypothetical protein